jgi:hypothetical protein
VPIRSSKNIRASVVMRPPAIAQAETIGTHSTLSREAATVSTQPPTCPAPFIRSMISGPS